ncbi:unnamed protein product [Amoebophrya sp. A25]|nr:unnamed protein product [Amoebophrya sp. A25]|eukprot:GSA25T00003632001.1
MSLKVSPPRLSHLLLGNQQEKLMSSSAAWSTYNSVCSRVGLRSCTRSACSSSPATIPQQRTGLRGFTSSQASASLLLRPSAPQRLYNEQMLHPSRPNLEVSRTRIVGHRGSLLGLHGTRRKDKSLSEKLRRLAEYLASDASNDLWKAPTAFLSAARMKRRSTTTSTDVGAACVNVSGNSASNDANAVRNVTGKAASVAAQDTEQVENAMANSAMRGRGGMWKPVLWLLMAMGWTVSTIWYAFSFEEWGREAQYAAVPMDIKRQKQRLCTQLTSSCLAMQATGVEVVNWCKQCLAAWTD